MGIKRSKACTRGTGDRNVDNYHMVIHAPRGQSEPVTFLKEDQHQIIKLCSALSDKQTFHNVINLPDEHSIRHG